MNKGYLFREWFEKEIGLDTYEKQHAFVSCRNLIERLDNICYCGYKLTFDTVKNKQWCSLCKKHL